MWKLEDAKVSEEKLKNENPLQPGSSSTGSAMKRKRSEDSHSALKRTKRGICVAVIVPFRDLHAEQKRQKHLDEFVPKMQEFLGRNQGVW